MSGLKHETNKAPGVTRPNFFPAEPCAAQVNLEYSPRPCSSAAHWLIPEVKYCAIHMPTEWLPILHRRALAWIDGVEDLWLEIVHDERQGRHEQRNDDGKR